MSQALWSARRAGRKVKEVFGHICKHTHLIVNSYFEISEILNDSFVDVMSRRLHWHFKLYRVTRFMFHGLNRWIDGDQDRELLICHSETWSWTPRRNASPYHTRRLGRLSKVLFIELLRQHVRKIRLIFEFYTKWIIFVYSNVQLYSAINSRPCFLYWLERELSLQNQLDFFCFLSSFPSFCQANFVYSVHTSIINNFSLVKRNGGVTAGVILHLRVSIIVIWIKH